MFSPTAYHVWACAGGFGRLRLVRARGRQVGLLVLVTSFLFFAFLSQCFGQYPIRQVPLGRNASATAGMGLPRPINQSLAGREESATAHPAIARIMVTEKDAVSFGSGTLVDARGQFGLVVTNWHVVRDASGPITVKFPDGFESPAQVVKTDRDWDLAALSIRRPHAEPLPVTLDAPQPGEWLTIAGYGGGNYRQASGMLSKYVAPSPDLPYEMLDLADVEARQGDSGGPIINQRGEVCGVLFGSGPGYTNGSYGGRVREFLATVIPGGRPGSDTAPPTSTLATKPVPPPGSSAGLTGDSAQGAPAINLNATSGWTPQPIHDSPKADFSSPPQATALHQPSPQSSSEQHSLRPLPNDDEQALTPAATVDRFHETPLTSTSADMASQSTANVYAPLPPRQGASNAADIDQAPPERLLAAAWKKLGGQTVLEQTKSVLAIIGMLSVVIQFWRFSSRKEPEVQED